MLASYQAQALEQQAKLQALQPQEDLETTIKKQYEDTYHQYATYDAFRIAVQDDKEYWTSKLFRRHKITTVDYEKSKTLIERRLETENIEPLEEEELVIEEPEYESEAEVLQYLERMLNYYKFLAGCYLKMNPEEFDRCDWGKLRLVIDACHYRTNNTLVPESKGLYSFFHLENAHGDPMTAYLTRRDREMLEMFRLWKGSAKIKPWNRNGGVMYEEDINTYLQLESMQIRGQEYKEGKINHRNNRGVSTSADGTTHRRTTRYKNR